MKWAAPFWNPAPGELLKVDANLSVPTLALLNKNMERIDRVIAKIRALGVARPLVILRMRRDERNLIYDDIQATELSAVLEDASPDFASAILQIDPENVPILILTSLELQICWRKPENEEDA